MANSVLTGTSTNPRNGHCIALQFIRDCKRPFAPSFKIIRRCHPVVGDSLAASQYVRTNLLGVAPLSRAAHQVLASFLLSSTSRLFQFVFAPVLLLLPYA